MHVLVSGGAGYIGSHTAKALHAAGFTPVTLDDLRRGHASAVKWGPMVNARIDDREAVKRAIAEHRVEAVLHFAADAYVRESLESPRAYFQNNVVACLAFLDAVLDAGVRRFVFSSTCAVFGIPATPSITERTPTVPINPYGESKLFIEKVLRWYASAYGLGWTALRYFNAAGADADGEIGECHEPEPHLIPRAIRAALRGGPPLPVLGRDFPTPDGTAVRDYVHVTDLADAHVKALERLIKGGESGPLNLGTGQGHSVAEVIAAVERAVGKPVPVAEAPRSPGDPPSLVADASAAQSALGWTPRCSDLDSIVTTAVRWQERMAREGAAT